ncbi:methyltransferase domain-containing protein [Falsiroseomonas sp. HW251]|uniref:methyltransferase domain-containing protein n=1 Tax=Falsiroseomonas sp. HW251 TaxID=3390998 RepID=UPI003D31EF0D
MADADPLPPPPDPQLCRRVPAGLGLVVEIGCGDGALGAWLARREPLGRRIATEADPDAAARAAPHYERVQVSPPEAGAPVPPGSADLVILRGAPADPVAAIRAAAALLAPEGTLLVEVPNAEHWRLAEAMLAGGARPVPLPPHAMTRDGLLGAIREAGLEALDVPPEVPDLAAARAFADKVAGAIGDTEAWLRRAAAPRWLLRAARRRPAPLVLLAHVLKPVGGVNDVRMDLPLGQQATHPGVALRLAERPETPQLPPGTPRILVLHRRLLATPDSPQFINHFRRAGWVIVQEFDDDPAHWPVIGQSDHFAFRGVHGVQTTTARLESLFRTFNEEIAVFPNTVAELPLPVNFADPSRLTLFLGALRREEDMAPFIPALNAVLAEAGPRLAVEVIFDRGTFDALATPHKRFHPLLPYLRYRELMARCEIAFLPLADTRFNSFKSDLKFVEAGAHRLACLASPVVYAGTIRDGANGRIVRTAEEFAAALRALLADPAGALAMGEAARGWVRENRMMAHQVPARTAWYRSLWERRAELDAALLRRAPECGA